MNTNTGRTPTISGHADDPGARIVFAAAIIAMGGFLFGYDTGVISGTVGSLKAHFHLNAWKVGLAGSSAILGCIPGSLIGGLLSDRLGRRKVLLQAAVLFAAAGLASSKENLFSQFVTTRFIAGLAIGASSVVCPVYIAEIAPPSRRGRLGAFFQLAIVASLFFLLLLNFFILRRQGAVWAADNGWRWMFGSEALPAAFFGALLLLIPESPQWLSGAVGSARFAEVFNASLRRPLLIAVCLPALAQFSGINAVMYYAPEVFQSGGATAGSALASTAAVGAVNLLFTFVALGLVDSAGRKPLLLGGAAFQTIALGCLGCLFRWRVTGIPTLICVLAFIAAFAMAMGPIPWIVISEIFPSHIRGRATAIGVVTVWSTCYLVAQTFPILLTTAGPSATFWIYSLFSACSFCFVLCILPETRGRRLEDIEASWKTAVEKSHGHLVQ